jgi:4-alpha-glucanotransferase
MDEDARALIGRLAALAGIAPGYRDTAGQFHPVSPEAQAALLRVLGHDVSAPSAIGDAIAALEAAPWRERLPPVAVLRPDPAPAVAVVVPERALAGLLAWRIRLEDGGERQGAVAPERLAVHARGPGSGGKAPLRLALPLPADLPPGYHRLEITCGDTAAETLLVQTPPRAFLPDWLAGEARAWAIGAPLFSLWSERSWGIGDFSDLGRLAGLAGGLGARLVGLNPLHAKLPGPEADPNPYLPSSRRFLNPLHIDVTALAAGRSPAGAWPEVASGVDYPLVHRRKHAALEAIFQGGQWDAKGLAAFRTAGGADLDRFAVFNALAERFAPRPWRDWPAGLRHPDAPGIAAARRELAARIDYHAWLQWVAECQLTSATASSAGLYCDLAVGVHPDGAEVWADPTGFLQGARFGAPPDAFAAEGQDWGLPPPDPRTLRARSYADFIATVRQNMRHAAALRLDHVMGLDRLYVIPPGFSARDGAYLRYPRADLLGLLALESQRQRCLLVGEDLGTVPEGLRETLSATGILSYRLLMFERWPNGLFRRPGAYPRLALASFATHDLPTLRGWWEGRDLPADPAAIAARRQDRALLLAALRDRGLAADGIDPETRDPALLTVLLGAVQRFLARAPAALLLANLGDLLAETAQINHPDAAVGAANWRHRYRLPIEALAADPTLRAIVAAIAAGRAGSADTEV